MSASDGQRDGVTDAKAHAEVFCANDSHSLLGFKVDVAKKWPDRASARRKGRGDKMKALPGKAFRRALSFLGLPVVSSLPFGLLDHLLEQVDVRRKGFLAWRSQGESCQ